MANLSQMVNVMAPIGTSKDGLFLQTIFFPVKLYRNHCGSRYIVSKVNSPTFSSKSFKSVPYLDVSASTGEQVRFISIAVVNRHETQDIAVTVSVKGLKLENTAIVFEINADLPGAENSFAQPGNVTIVKKSAAAGEKFSYTFPAHSITLLKIMRS